MNVSARLKAVEKVALPMDVNEYVIFVTVFPYDPPSVCKESLLAVHRIDHPDDQWRFVDLVDDDGRCLACGKEHTREV